MILVSVYITTRNRLHLLERALLSVLNQSCRDLEIIIVDDASACDNEAMVRAQQRNTSIPITYLRNDVARGACYARNLAIAAARGKFITGLDDDDEFVPVRIERLLEKYEEKYAFVCANDNLILKNGDTRSTKRPEYLTREVLLNATENLVGNQVFTSKEKLLAIGGFDESFPAFQDFDTFYRLTERFGTGLVVQENLQNIYRNDNTPNISTQRNQFFGILNFYLKHRQQMTLAQRKRFILRYRLLKGKMPGMERNGVKTLHVFAHSGKGSLRNNLVLHLKNRLGRKTTISTS